MGDPRKQRRKYTRPKHPWRSERIEAENELCKKYGLKNKTEVWRAISTLRGFRQQARKLLGMPDDEDTKKEAKKLLDKLSKRNIINTTSLDDVLSLTIEGVLERRLQTLVCRRGIANTMKQARQLIIHGKVKVGGKVINVPRYPVSKAEEDTIQLVTPEGG